MDTILTLEIFDTLARQKSVYSSSDAQSISNLEQLREDGWDFAKYATLEEDFFLLDGSFQPFSDDFSKFEDGIGWWSQSLSDANGDFASPPQLLIRVMGTEIHTGPGLTLTFAEDYPLQIKLEWKTREGATIYTDTYQPDSLEYFCRANVENYGQVVLTVLKAKPHRYVKLNRVDFGQRRAWDSGQSLVEAKIVEEVDPISSQLSINTLDFTLYGAGEYNVMSPTGVMQYLQESQRVTVVQVLDTGERIPMGSFYLSTWESSDNDIGRFTAQSPIGLLDSRSFLGDIYAQYPAGQLIADIMDAAGVEDYQVEEPLRLVPVSGWVPICTCREALQQVAFALGAIVEDNRSNTIRIHSLPRKYGRMIRIDQQFEGSTIQLLEAVSGVEVTAHSYAKSQAAEEVWKGTLSGGIHTVEFDAPAAEVSAAPVGPSCANALTLRVTGDTQEVVLTGKKYTDSVLTVTQSAARVSGSRSNVKKVDKATLVTLDNAQDACQRLLEHYGKRYQLQVQYLPYDESAGEMVAVQSITGDYQMYTILSMELDLTGGMVANATLVSDGKSLLITDYTGEFYAGERIGVI